MGISKLSLLVKSIAIAIAANVGLDCVLFTNLKVPSMGLLLLLFFLFVIKEEKLSFLFVSRLSEHGFKLEP